MATMQLEIVAAEENIFSGEAEFVVLRSEGGELGILPRHAPLLAKLVPGAVRIINDEGKKEESYFVSGGMVEIQPNMITVLADTVMRASDLDEKAAHEAMERAKSTLADPARKMGTDYAKARTALAEAAAQIQMLQRMRRAHKN